MANLVRLDELQQFAAVNLSSDPGAIAGPVHIPSCAQLVLVWSLEDGKTAVNVLYGRYAGTYQGSNAQSNTIFNALTTGAQWTALAAFLATTTHLTNFYTRDVNTPNNPINAASGNGPPGTSPGTSLPNEVAVVVTLPTAKTGQAFRGRFFVPGWATNALGTGNLVAGPASTALTNWVSGFKAIFAASGYTWVLGQKARAGYTSPTTGRVFPPRDPIGVDITTPVVRDNHWDTQRRRGLR